MDSLGVRLIILQTVNTHVLTKAQIRVTADQKRRLKRRARDAGMDMSSWILDRVLPPENERFQALARALAEPKGREFALAELADFLRPLRGGAFARATSEPPRAPIDPVTLNHLAGASELASAKRAVAPPPWTARVPVPAHPVFGTTLNSARLYLLTHTPVAFRRRNVFVDSSIDERA